MPSSASQQQELPPLDNKMTWQIISTYMERAKCHLAFPILVKMAKDGDPEAHYMATQIKLIHPAVIGALPEAGELETLPVKANPFQNVPPNHPAYQIAIKNPLNLIKRAREGRGRAAMLAGLYYMAKNETTGSLALHSKRRPRYAWALKFFLTSLRDPDHHANNYNVELIRRNVCTIVQNIHKAYCDTQNRKTTAIFVDGSQANMDMIDESYRIIGCLKPG